MPRPDHAPLDSLAHELAASADRVRAAAAALRDRASALPWQSPAARAFEQAFGEFLVQLRGLAGHLDSAAQLAREHAGRAAHRAELARAALGALERVARR